MSRPTPPSTPLNAVLQRRLADRSPLDRAVPLAALLATIASLLLIFFGRW